MMLHIIAATGFLLPATPNHAQLRTSALTMGAIGDPADSVLNSDDYMAVGLSAVFRMNPDTNKANQVWQVEPLTSGTLETVTKGIATSYKRLLGIRVGDLLDGDLSSPTGIKPGSLGQLVDGYDEYIEADQFVERALAGGRTFRRREQTAPGLMNQLLPIGEVIDELNFSTKDKRLIDYVKEVDDSDNVKQDMSIDVYGRKNDGDLQSEIDRLANI